MWLLKTEPGTYSFADLARDRTTVWDGVTAAPAQKALRAISKGDDAFIYHTGDERAIVGLARVAGGPRPDPSSDNPAHVAVEIAAVKAAKTPVTLARIKADRRFASFALVKQSRLSVMAVPPELEAVLREWAGL